MLLKAVGFLSACNPLTEEVKVADALDNSLRGKSFPSVLAIFELPTAFFAIAFGSNLPAYGVGDARACGVLGEAGESREGDTFAF